MEILSGLLVVILLVAAFAAIRTAEKQRNQAWPFGVSKRALRRAGWYKKSPGTHRTRSTPRPKGPQFPTAGRKRKN
jgi:hypothetical protein